MQPDGALLRIAILISVVLGGCCQPSVRQTGVGRTDADLAAAVDAASWSRFRGPNGSGIAATTGLPVELGPATNVVWKTAVPPGLSSPVLSKSSVFLTGADGDDLVTLCLSRSTGEERWRRVAPRPRRVVVDGRNGPASPTPAVGRDLVVVFFADYGMLAYDHAGEELWRLPLGPFDNVYGMGASPVLFDGTAYLPCDQNVGSFLVAVGARDGEVRWRAERPMARSGHCTPIVYQPPDGVAQLVLPGSFLLDAYDTRNGDRVWWVGGLSFEMKSVPVLAGGKVFINGYGSPLNQPGNQVEVPAFAAALAEHDADGDGAISKSEMPKTRAAGFFEFVDLDHDGALGGEDWGFLRAALASQNGMLAIEPGGRGDMTASSVAWSYRRSVPQLPSPLVYQDVLYMLGDQGGLLTTLRPENGEVVERGRLRDAIDSYYASPVAGDGKVYFVSVGGLVSVLPAGGSLEPLAVGDLDEPCYATPALAGGRIYLRTRGALYCFGLP